MYVCVCVSEISNLLVVTKDRAPDTQAPMLSFHRILKEEIEQVPTAILCLSPMSCNCTLVHRAMLRDLFNYVCKY